MGVVSEDSDVALLSPAGSPGVLDQPELLSGWLVDSVAHQEDSMVELVSAFWVAEHSGLVVEPLVGFDSDGNSLLQNGGLELRAAVWRHGLPSRNLVGALWLIVAFSVLSSVRVVLLGRDAVLLDEGKGVGHLSSVAAVVTVLGAVDEVLFGEADELSGVEGVRALEGSGGGEGPAGAHCPWFLTGVTMFLDLQSQLSGGDWVTPDSRNTVLRLGSEFLR